MKEKKYEEHPSYGLLGFSRAVGGNPNLFGSSVPHTDKIIMKLKHAKAFRSGNSDWYLGGNLIAEIEMSYTQFAEAITCMNVGEGVPVTILYTDKDGKAPACEFELSRKQFENEFSSHLKETNEIANNLISEAKEYLNKPRLTKAEREDLLRKLEKISQEIGVNSEFVLSQFNKQMDKSVVEAKNEIEAFAQYRVNELGLEKLAELKEIQMLPEDNNE